MKYKVFLISDAEEDLFEIYKYVALKDSTNKAQTLIQKLKDTCFSLAELPKRGHIPPELERIGVYDFFEIHYKPFRIIYQIIETKVYIHCVLDGRRDLQELLYQRLIR